MKLFEKLFGNNNNIDSLIEESKKQIAKSPTGHFSLSYRVKLNKRIADENTILKIYLECVKKANTEDNPLINEMLHKATAFLYHGQGDKQYFLEFADNHRNYFADIVDAEGLAGLAACWFAYNIVGGTEIEDYNGVDDDNAYEWEDWTPDFYASMAYTGGNPFVGEGDITKRKEFWLWFLDTVLQLSKDSSKPLLDLKPLESTTEKKAGLFKRTQTDQTKEIQLLLDKILNTTIQLVSNQENSQGWQKVLIENCSLKSGISVIIHFINNAGDFIKMDNIDNFSQFSTINQSLNKVKQAMYQQIPNEGAWIMSNVTVFNNQSYDVSFNYDDINTFTQVAQDPSNLLREFEAYPRSKKYTPEWWQKILGKKAKYLE